jgi:hypothetical protein
MQNIAPLRSLTRRSNDLKTLALVVGAIGLFLAALGLLLRVINLSGFATNTPQFGTYDFIRNLMLFGGILILLIAGGMLIRAFTWKTDNDLAKITGNVLGQQLDDRFTLIRNVSKRQIGYVDAILVGPPGVLVFRILDSTGVYANEGSNWLRQDAGGGWKPASIRPTVECVADINKVREYLDMRGIPETPVYGVVVFTKEAPVTQLMAREPVVPITPLSALTLNLQPNYLAKDRMDKPKVDAIVNVLFN